MAAVLNSCKLVLVSAMLMAAMTSVNAGGDSYNQLVGLGWMPTATARSPCNGSIGECSEGIEMDSEISRRILQTTRYISYGALHNNNIPCERRGASYYNCQPGAQANPYDRGCSRITRCRG
ncbi:hypothetical protein GQ457_10G013390 [Hibiscus cannabinus]